jgi:hypothetical protein
VFFLWKDLLSRCRSAEYEKNKSQKKLFKADLVLLPSTNVIEMTVYKILSKYGYLLEKQCLIMPLSRNFRHSVSEFDSKIVLISHEIFDKNFYPQCHGLVENFSKQYHFKVYFFPINSKGYQNAFD